MGFLIESVVSAAKLAATMDPAVYGAAFVSLTVAGVATSICGIIGIPAGYVLAVRRFRGRQITLALLNTMLALPTVVVGLFVYSFLTRRSLLGPLDLLFTKRAMVIGELTLWEKTGGRSGTYRRLVEDEVLQTEGSVDGA